jgi:AcrR family transcriptional regulator
MYVVKNSKKRRHTTVTMESRRPARGMSRQQARTMATRQRLLVAAGRIFARDGFEAARLEDIAAAAGYTRGAFYANFEDKEEVFFALLEQWVGERMAEVTALLGQKQRHPKGQLRTLRNYYARSAKDRHLALLSLEFSLHAIRHPAAHARLRIRMRRLRSCAAGLVRRIAESKGHSLPVSARAATAALGALSNALFLEHRVDQEALTEEDVRRLLGIFFDAILSRGPAN